MKNVLNGLDPHEETVMGLEKIYISNKGEYLISYDYTNNVKIWNNS